jgi:hypothetical protein
MHGPLPASEYVSWVNTYMYVLVSCTTLRQHTPAGLLHGGTRMGPGVRSLPAVLCTAAAVCCAASSGALRKPSSPVSRNQVPPGSATAYIGCCYQTLLPAGQLVQAGASTATAFPKQAACSSIIQLSTPQLHRQVLVLILHAVLPLRLSCRGEPGLTPCQVTATRGLPC